MMIFLWHPHLMKIQMKILLKKVLPKRRRRSKAKKRKWWFAILD